MTRATINGREHFVMMVNPIAHAMLVAFKKHNGRDRRRIKREMKKAAKAARSHPAPYKAMQEQF